jgi:hypothetical protein
MLQAMNTGHEGSLTTIHANAPRDMLSRLETMVLMAGMEIPMKAIREQALSALDIIVFQARLKDGTRKILNITEVVGMEGDTITLQDIFVKPSCPLEEESRDIFESKKSKGALLFYQGLISPWRTSWPRGTYTSIPESLFSLSWFGEPF